MSEALIEAKQLYCERSGRELFRGLSFEIEAGSLTHLVGQNGAGKTTLLKILTGLYTSYEGEIIWNGENISRCKEAYLPQILYIGHKPAIKMSLTPLENLKFLCGLEGKEVDSNKILKAIGAVGLSGYENILCAYLSAGQARRVALARLYLSSASIWFLDEAFTALDVESSAALERFLMAKAKAGVTIVITSHHEFSIEGVSKLALSVDMDEEHEE